MTRQENIRRQQASFVVAFVAQEPREKQFAITQTGCEGKSSNTSRVNLRVADGDPFFPERRAPESQVGIP